MNRQMMMFLLVSTLCYTACAEESSQSESAAETKSTAAAAANDATDTSNDRKATDSADQLAQNEPAGDALFGAQPGAAESPKPIENLKDKISYFIGQSFGRNIMQQRQDKLDTAELKKGLDAGLKGDEAGEQSYAIGVVLGDNFKNGDEEIDIEKVIQGLRDVMADKTSKTISFGIGVQLGDDLRRSEVDVESATVAEAAGDTFEAKEKGKYTAAELEAAATEFQAQMLAKQRERQMEAMKKQMEEQQKVAAENLKKAEAFLAENKTKPGVKVTESGLQYKVLKQGTGASPGPKDKFKAVYKGTLIDGTVFDSNTPETPLELGVDEVVPGWTEALQLMKVGGKWMVYIHPKLGYGEFGRGEIPPNAALIFEMELLGFEKAGAE